MSNQDRSSFNDNSVNDSHRMRALVVNRVDPRMEGRIGVIIPRLMPFADPNLATASEKNFNIESTSVYNTELKGMISNKASTTNYIWARPQASAAGNFRVPYVGKTVYVYMEDGDPNKLYYEPTRPTLNGETPSFDNVRTTRDVFTPESRPNIHMIEEFKDGTSIYYNENSATREFEIRYANGSTISLAHHEGSEQFEVLMNMGHTLVLDQKNFKIFLRTKDLHLIELDDGETKGIRCTTTGGHTFQLDDTGKKILAKTTGGHSIDMDDGGGSITTTCSGGAKIVMNGANVNIN